MKLKIILLSALATISCCPKFYPHRTENIEHTITVTETIRDTIIQVQPDSSIVQALIKCDSTGQARLDEIRTLKESARVRQTLALKDNRITSKVVVDSMGIYLTYKERHKEEQQVQTIETVIEKETNVLKWWQKALMWMGIFSMIFSLITVALKMLLKP